MLLANHAFARMTSATFVIFVIFMWSEQQLSNAFVYWVERTFEHECCDGCGQKQWETAQRKNQGFGIFLLLGGFGDSVGRGCPVRGFRKEVTLRSTDRFRSLYLLGASNLEPLGSIGLCFSVVGMKTENPPNY